MSTPDIYSSFTKTFFESYLDHVCYLSLPENSLKQLIGTLDKDIIILDMESDYTPMKPFMEIISRYRPSESTIEESTYTLQRTTFKTYLKYGVAVDRGDIVIPIETYYEKLRCRQTVIELLKQVPDAKFVILNTQMICEESIDIIKELENTETNAKFVFCFDAERMESSSDVICDFFDTLSNQKNFFTISDLDNEVLAKENKPVSKEPSYDFDILLNSLRNSRMFLSLGQGCELSDWIARDINRFDFNNLQNRSLYMEMALNYFYAGRYDTASLYLNNVIEEQRDDELDIAALFYSCYVFYLKNANVSALKYAKLVIERLKNNKGSQYYAYAKMMSYIIMERAGSDSTIDKYNEAIRLLMDHQFYNNCINTTLTMPWSFVDDATRYVEIIPKADEAEVLARKIDNQFGLSTACHWKGILCSKMEKPKEANRWYQECNKIRTEIGELSAIIKIRNGLSYEYLLNAKFKDSYNLINGFVGRLNELSDYPEIIITLQNIARSLFFSHHFTEAYPLYSAIVHLLHLLNLEGTVFNSFLPEYNDILVYKSLIDFYNGDIIRAKINHHNISHNGKPMTAVDKPLLNLLKALIDLYDGKFDEAEKVFKTVVEDTKKFGAQEDYRIIFVNYEFAYWLEKYNMPEKAKFYFQKGFELAHSRGMEYYTKGKKSGLTLKDYTENLEEFEKLNVNLSYIEEKAEKERLVNQLHGRLRDSQFLNKIMTLGSEMTNYKVYSGSVLQAMFDYTTAEAIVICKKTNGKWEQLSSIFRSDIVISTPKEWEKLLKKQPVKSNVYIDRQKGWYIYDISKFEFEGIIFVCQNQTTLFTQDEMNVMNIAVTSIQAQLVMFTQNEHLTYMSSIDQLSQLKNRRALTDFIALEDEKLRRFNSKTPSVEESICFVDLDNFKFYNDNYGHEAGDLLISGFAKLLRHVFRKIDFIGRFGGDEFIVILPNTDCKSSKKICNRLYKALEEKNYFIDDLEELLGNKVEVAPENRLGFSAGISSNFDCGELYNLTEVINKADHALYYSKENGKGKASIWSEVKEFIDEETDSVMDKGC